MKRFNLRLNSQDLKRAAKEIGDYSRELDEKGRQLSNLIAERLRDEAATLFSAAVVDDYVRGNPDLADVTVRVESNGNVCVVIAEGEEAVFAEFGTGVYHNGSAGSSPHPLGARLGMTIGSYGKGNGRKSTWGFYDETGQLRMTHGAPASMPMYKALLHVCDEVEKLAREVFAS